MRITVADLLRNELLWNKELVQIWFENESGDIIKFEVKRLEFQYEAIDEEYIVDWLEPYSTKEGIPYLVIHCSKDDD